MNTTNIFLVVGNAGSFDDQQEWVVCAYAAENLALARIAKLEELMTTLQVYTKDCDLRKQAVAAIQTHESGDEFFCVHYPIHTTYSCQSVKFFPKSNLV